MLILKPGRLHWIKDDGADDPQDLCAHADVLFEVNGASLISADDNHFTVSAAAIYLLRTLEKDHQFNSADYVKLFPHCGHSLFDLGGNDVVISGCNIGVDFGIHRTADRIRIETADNQCFEVSFVEWQQVVFHFSDEVREFYNQSAPKQPHDDYDRRCFELMMSEWDRRRNSG